MYGYKKNPRLFFFMVDTRNSSRWYKKRNTKWRQAIHFQIACFDYNRICVLMREWMKISSADQEGRGLYPHEIYLKVDG